MSLQEKTMLMDEVYIAQPNLLASAIVHMKSGASAENVDVLLNIILVTFDAMRAGGHSWPQVTERVQAQCLARVVGRIKFARAIPNALRSVVAQQQIDEHPEKYLFAFIVSQLHAVGLHEIWTDAERHLVLAAINIAESVAYAVDA